MTKGDPETPTAAADESANPAPISSPAMQDYFFPQYGVTVAAVSREHAERQLADLLAKNKNE